MRAKLVHVYRKIATTMSTWKHNLATFLLDLEPRSILLNIVFLGVGALSGYVFGELDLVDKTYSAVLQSDWPWLTIQTVIILVSLVLIYEQIKLQRLSNMLQPLSQLRTEWYGKEMCRHRRTVLQRYQIGPSLVFVNAETEVANFFDELGSFHKKRIIPTDLIWDGYCYHIERIWPILEKGIKATRESDNDQTYFENFGELWKDMRDYSRRRGLSGITPVFRTLT